MLYRYRYFNSNWSSTGQCIYLIIIVIITIKIVCLSVSRSSGLRHFFHTLSSWFFSFVESLFQEQATAYATIWHRISPSCKIPEYVKHCPLHVYLYVFTLTKWSSTWAQYWPMWEHSFICHPTQLVPVITIIRSGYSIYRPRKDKSPSLPEQVDVNILLKDISRRLLHCVETRTQDTCWPP